MHNAISFCYQISFLSSFFKTSFLIFLTANNKDELEKATGLKILQIGLGEVSDCGTFHFLQNFALFFVKFSMCVNMSYPC